jgi:hypothetical protein
VRFLTGAGRPIVSIDEWVRARQHLPGGRAARLLGRRWLDAGGFPDAFRAAVLERPLRDAAFERAVVGQHGRETGQAGYLGELVVVGDGIVVTVDGRLDEGFGDAESQWLLRGLLGGTVPRKERQDRAAAQIGLPITAVPASAWQLVHRIGATCDEARRLGRGTAVVAVHGFLPTSRRACGFDVFRRLAGLLAPAHPPLEPGRSWRAGVHDGVELWLLWVSDDWNTVVPVVAVNQ